MITADDIRWELSDVSPSEPMSFDDFVVDTLLELYAYRLLARQALHYCADLTLRLEREIKRRESISNEYVAFEKR